MYNTRMRHKRQDDLEIRGSERLLFVFAAPPLVMIFTFALISIHDAFGGRFAHGKAARAADFVFLALFSELFIAIIAFLILGFIYGLCAPRWIERGLANAKHHLGFVFGFFVVGFFLLVAAFYVTR